MSAHHCAPNSAHTDAADSAAAIEGPLTTSLVRQALRMADAAIICDIEMYADRVGALPGRVYDLRPMVDEREWGPEYAEQAAQGLGYAMARGLIMIDPRAPHLAHITTAGQAL